MAEGRRGLPSVGRNYSEAQRPGPGSKQNVAGGLFENDLSSFFGSIVGCCHLDQKSFENQLRREDDVIWQR